VNAAIKMIALDLDGTLFNEHKEITQASYDTIQEAIRQGILVIPTTGRPVAGIPPSILSLPGVRYIITSNGARVVELTPKQPFKLDEQARLNTVTEAFDVKVLYEHLLSKEAARRALHILKKYDTLCEVYYQGQGYAPKKQKEEVQKYHNNPAMWQYFWSTRVFVEDLEVLVGELDGDLDKIQSLFVDMDERQQALEELQMCNEYTLVGSLLYNIEVNAKDVNKGISLLYLAESLGISADQVMAIGDGDNDYEMICQAGVGIAMANAEEHVLQAAKYITKSNNEDGVSYAIRTYALQASEDLTC